MSPKILRQVFVFFYLLILVIPLYTVLQNTGDLTRFWTPTVEPGEITYFFLRLMGLYGFIFSHPLFFLAIGLVFFHSFNVGSDTRTYPMTLVYPITG
ncbi:MAG: hypothetical protein HY377_02560, partial [Candidatus Blackburnbacteria bacterium]|nr:hypothetical protein [Candidatus Blackburnbacteria bacterium]